jgi:hypothetical protein
MPGKWAFTDEDKARLEPLLARLVAQANAGMPIICRLSGTVEGRIRILQGYCEALGDRMTEEILQQIDRGEWTSRGIKSRDDVSITVVVDAAGSVLENAQLLHLTMLPTESLS